MGATLNMYRPFISYNYEYCYGYPHDYAYNIGVNPMVRQRLSNGQRVQQPGLPRIYLVDNGRLRWIVDADVYMGIFKDWKGILSVNVQSYPQGPPLVRGTLLFKHPNNPRVYLYDKEDGRRWVKRWIVNPHTFNFYHFDWNKIQIKNPSTFNPPNGSNIVAR